VGVWKQREGRGGGFELVLAFTADLEQVPLKGIKMPVGLSLKKCIILSYSTHSSNLSISNFAF
jgi:hypothetical protein